MTGHSSRRTFLLSSAAVTLATSQAARASRRSPSNAVRMGIIGCGGRGTYLLQHLKKHPDVRIMAVCDVYAPHRDRARSIAGGDEVRAHTDLRELLDAKDIDAVVVAPPGHWHCPATILACQAGKDVYVEKPLGSYLAEGRAAVEAARKYDRIVQIGTQQKSWDIYRKAVETIRSGRLGRISLVETWDNENHSPGYGNPPDGEAPQEVDWNIWLGQAPERPYNPSRFAHHYWYFDYGGGWPLDWAVHHYDIIHWAMGVQAPISAVSAGGRYALKKEDDAREWPDTLTAALEYGPGPVATEGFLLQYMTRSGAMGPVGETRHHGKIFYGTDASMILNRGGYTIVTERGNGSQEEVERVGGESEDQAVSNHTRAFLDAVTSHQKPVADVETGHLATNPGHLINIAWRLGRKVHWDATAEKFVNDPEADALLTRTCRSPWSITV